jgi:glyoxylase I family protein
MSGFPAAVHHVALTVTDLEASRAWYRRLLGADPVLDEDVPPVAGHHTGYHHTLFAPESGCILSFRDPDGIALEFWAPRS